MNGATLTPLFKYENNILAWPNVAAGQTIPKAQRSQFNTSGRGSVGLGLVVAILKVLMGLQGGFYEPSRAAWTAYPMAASFFLNRPGPSLRE